jgi:TM2 domain-containing membrane protein YozV
MPASAKAYDPNTVFIIEMVGGFFGFLGLGYFYVGRTNDGLLRLLIWFAYNLIAWVIIGVLLALIIGLVCIPFQVLIQIAVPIWSAMTLKNELMKS